MRRHTHFKSLEVEGEFLWVHPALFYTLHKFVVVVDTLCAAVYLEPTEEKVEPARVWRFRRLFVGVKCALFGGEFSNEYEVTPLFFLCPLANSAFMLGFEVRFFANTQNLLCFAQSQNWK